MTAHAIFNRPFCVERRCLRHSYAPNLSEATVHKAPCSNAKQASRKGVFMYTLSSLPYAPKGRGNILL